MNIDQAIRCFAQFLDHSWNDVIKFNIDNESINDWLQVNWEILVERQVLQLNERLEVYGEGADLYGSSSRIIDIHALPNFRIKLIGKREQILDLLSNEEVIVHDGTFDKLVTFKNGFYFEEPDFKFVLIRDAKDQERVFSLDGVEFVLEKI